MGAIVIVVGFFYMILAHIVSSPHRFSDELMYWDAAGSLADGHGIRVRGAPYIFGPLYPAILAPILWAVPHRDLAYELAKTVNAVLFSFVAVPTYLLARRMLRPWSSVGVALLSIAVPWARYVSVITTESLAYFAAAWAFYAIFLVLERPTLKRQAFALSVLGVAFAARPQLAVLGIAYFVSVVAILVATHGRGRRDALISFWPSALALGLVLLGLIVPRLMRGESVAHWASGYSVLLRTYRVGPVCTWFVYQLANLELALAVVPFAIMPIVVVMFLARAREGSASHRAFLVLFVSSTASFLAVAALFNSTPWGSFALHDRVVFYLVPLWLVVLFAWLDAGMPRPRSPMLVGAIGSLLLPLALALNFSDYARDDALEQFNGVATTLWADLRAALAPTPVPGWVVLLLFALALTAATVFLSPSRAKLLPALVLAVFVVTGELSWLNAGRVADAWGASIPRGERRWVDERIQGPGAVTIVVVPGSCASYQQTNDALYLTEFFNSAVRSVVYVGQRQDSLPAEVLHADATGGLVGSSGRPTKAQFVVVETGLDLRGERLGTGALGRLTLWRVDGALRLREPLTRRQLAAVTCHRAS